jgi:uncharacterized protein
MALCYNSNTMTEKLDIAKQVDLLFKLQGIDTQIYSLRAEQDEKPVEIAQLKDSLESKKAGIKDAEEKLKSLQLKHKEKEIALGSKEGEIKKLEGQLYQIKTNKEYTAMINEIESRKADNSLLEEEIINIIDSIDHAKLFLEKEKEKFNRESDKANAQIGEIEKQIIGIKSEISGLDKKRQELIPSIESKLLKEYERVLTGRNGQALAEVANNACGGCYMQLPAQVINEIRMKHNIIRCENCQRILYIDHEASNS